MFKDCLSFAINKKDIHLLTQDFIMTTQSTNRQASQYARLGGVLYLLIIVAGIFAQVFVRSKLIVSGDADATAANIIANELLFRSGVAAELMMLIFDVALALIFYVILRPINKNLALFAAFLRITMSSISAINSLNQMDVLLWLKTPASLAFSPEAINALAYHSLKAHSFGYHIALVFFGFYCMSIGVLIFRSNFLPKVLGILMVIASISYLINSFVSILAPNLASYLGMFILLPALVAELSLALWLTIKGVNMKQYDLQLNVLSKKEL